MSERSAPGFTGLIDLAAEELGGRVLFASDEFFAPALSLIRPGPAVFVPGKFTERGKWMDGWESRRRRGPGHDHCVIELGVPGRVLGLDIDTQHFLGNHPPFASVEGQLAVPGTPPEQLAQGPWRTLLPQAPLRPGSQNLFVVDAADSGETCSHVRLSIFPDGGVARFRVYGKVDPSAAARRQRPRDEDTARRVAPEHIDLAALENGALALACSDAFFGPMNNLLLPGSASDMGGGWETRRKRAPGHDYILIRLAGRGLVRVLELDTRHFRGNYPDGASASVIDAPPDARISELALSDAFVPLLPRVPLAAHTRHFFVHELASHPPATHLRLDIYPDGGVSRLRAWGELA